MPKEFIFIHSTNCSISLYGPSSLFSCFMHELMLFFHSHPASWPFQQMQSVTLSIMGHCIFHEENQFAQLLAQITWSVSGVAAAPVARLCFCTLPTKIRMVSIYFIYKRLINVAIIVVDFRVYTLKHCTVHTNLNAFTKCLQFPCPLLIILWFEWCSWSSSMGRGHFYRTTVRAG